MEEGGGWRLEKVISHEGKERERKRERKKVFERKKWRRIGREREEKWNRIQRVKNWKRENRKKKKKEKKKEEKKKKERMKLSYYCQNILSELTCEFIGNAGLEFSSWLKLFFHSIFLSLSHFLSLSLSSHLKNVPFLPLSSFHWSTVIS